MQTNGVSRVQQEGIVRCGHVQLAAGTPQDSNAESTAWRRPL
jgi:hypothetical protein